MWLVIDNSRARVIDYPVAGTSLVCGSFDIHIAVVDDRFPIPFAVIRLSRRGFFLLALGAHSRRGTVRGPHNVPRLSVKFRCTQLLWTAESEARHMVQIGVELLFKLGSDPDYDVPGLCDPYDFGIPFVGPILVRVVTTCW